MQQATQSNSVVSTVESGYAVPNQWWSPLCGEGVYRKLVLVAALTCIACCGWPVSALAAPSDCTLFCGDVTVQSQFSVSCQLLTITNYASALSTPASAEETPRAEGWPQFDVASLGQVLQLHRNGGRVIPLLGSHAEAAGQTARRLRLKVGYGQWMADKPLGAWIGNGTALEEPSRFFLAATLRF